MLTRPSRMWRIAPKRALDVLTMMLVPAATSDGTPNSRRTGSLTVPRARPTKPPTMPTPKDMTVNSTASHTRASEGRPSSCRVMVKGSGVARWAWFVAREGYPCRDYRNRRASSRLPCMTRATSIPKLRAK